MSLTPGKYRARARQWAWGISSKDNEQLAILFEFLDYPGVTMTAYRSFTDEAFDYSIAALRTCGWQGDDFEDLTGLDANEVQLVLENDTYEGKTELKIKYINSTGGIALKKAMEPASLKTFAQRMKGRIKAADQAAGRNPGATTSKPPWEASDSPPV